MKGETLLPLALPAECVTPATQFALTVHVFAEKAASFVLYEDDGTTLDFEKGIQNRLELRWDGKAGHVARRGQYDGPSRYRIVGWER